ncbi:hypothetical protein X766_19575 [Mesorhizobium sp. LSJC255A00]|nr:hypothetical protein X766_19575 [Mesorhizobium sp. LSJC255A00]
MGIRFQWFARLMAIAAALGATLPPAQCEDAHSLIVPLIKLEYPGEPRNIRMLYVKILSLGDHTVSSGTGIKITKDQQIDGIMVTTQQAVMTYGTYDEYGNVAYARVAFGSPKSPVATITAIPFLIRYKVVRRSTGEIVGGPLWAKGTFGISPVGGGGPDRIIKSPLAYVNFGPGPTKAITSHRSAPNGRSAQTRTATARKWKRSILGCRKT